MFVMFAGIYYGAAYGGSTTSILLNTPGEAASLVTALEGNKMARRGRAGQALATAAIGSFVAGTIGTLALTFVAPWVVEAALAFGPAEYFSLMVLSLVAVSAVLGSSMLRGLVALAAGLLFGMVGVDLQTGQPRFTFGRAELLDGIEVTVAAVGLFAVGEAMFLAWQGRESKAGEVMKMSGSLWMGGAIEGVAGPEAANNAAVTATLAPLLTLGIPVSSTTAILLAAFQNYQLQPGPTLLQTSGTLVWTLIASLYIGNVMLLVLNLPLVGLWVRVLRIPAPLLQGGILVFATLGAWSLRQSWFDLLLLLLIGLLGLAMRRFGFPAAPVIVGMILGPMADKQLRNALSISQGDWSVFLTRPLCLALVVLVVVVLLLPLWHRRIRRGVVSE